MSEHEETSEVLEFLQELDSTETAEKEINPFLSRVQLTEEEANALQDSRDEDDTENNVKDVPEIPVRDDFTRKPHQDLFSMLVADIGEVTVSDYEKDMFIKAVLNDSQFSTVSKVLSGKLHIEVKARTMYSDKLIFDSLNYDEQNKNIVGLDSMLFRLQMYVAACQLKSYGAKNVELHLDPEKTFEENYKILNNHVDKVLARIPSHVWAAITMGIRIHEYKSKLCMDNLNNENFWESAGTN